MSLLRHLSALCVCFLCISSGEVFGASPPAWWLAGAEDTYTNTFVGRGYAQSTNANSVQNLEANAFTEAVADAARAVCCQVTTEMATRNKETGEGRNAQIEQVFESRSQVRTLLRRVPGSKVLKKDVRSDRVFLLAGIPRAELRQAYKVEHEALLGRLESMVTTASQLAENEPMEAAKVYGEALALHDDIEDCRWMLDFLAQSNNVAAASLPEESSRKAVETAVRRLNAGMTGLLQGQLVTQMVAAVRPNSTGTVSFFVYPLTYCRTDVVSQFGDRLTELLAVELGAKQGWTRRKDPVEATVFFAGRVSECGNGVQVVFQRIAADGSVEAATPRFLSRETCENLKLGPVKPEDWERVVKDAVALRQKMATDSGLKIELRIAGMPVDAPIVLREGDRPVLELRANRDCSNRVVHIFADGTRAVLLDRFAIGIEQANQWVRVPAKIRITPPFGVEQVLVQSAADGDLPEIKTRKETVTNEDGKTIGTRTVVLGDLKSELLRVRGSVNEAVFSENIYTWTVREKQK